MANWTCVPDLDSSWCVSRTSGMVAGLVRAQPPQRPGAIRSRRKAHIGLSAVRLEHLACPEHDGEAAATAHVCWLALGCCRPRCPRLRSGDWWRVRRGPSSRHRLQHLAARGWRVGSRGSLVLFTVVEESDRECIVCAICTQTTWLRDSALCGRPLGRQSPSVFRSVRHKTYSGVDSCPRASASRSRRGNDPVGGYASSGRWPFGDRICYRRLVDGAPRRPVDGRLTRCCPRICTQLSAVKLERGAARPVSTPRSGPDTCI